MDIQSNIINMAHTTWDKFISGDNLIAEAKERKEAYEFMRVTKAEKATVSSAKWEVYKEYKNGSAMLRRPKKTGDAFEDEIWTLFYRMGFTIMNEGRKFVIQYGDSESESKQIDVMAMDEETCILVECKSTASEDATNSWKKEIESINGYKNKLFNEIKKQYRDKKFKYVFATKNFVLSKDDENRLKGAQIYDFDEDAYKYYSGLVDRLGRSAKYQLLGDFFKKQTVKGIDSLVPAIRSKMGKETYYSFTIEPSKLLKLGYILHRINANNDMMPTYQRLINSQRLTAIRKFVNEGNYFPNSLIVSIDTDGKELQFDKAQDSCQVKDSVATVGILHLPQKYQSIYVIDGQHRLYGYSESEHADKDCIPVVAFVNLDKDKQVKMFMDINENQKKVSKDLRNTLNIDLLWESEIPAQRNTSLILYIAEEFGSDKNSPLYKRIVTGENPKTTKTCITTETIRLALTQSHFLNTYKGGSKLARSGPFDRGNNRDSHDVLYPFLIKSLKTIYGYDDFIKKDWDKGSDGFIATNNGIFGILKVLSDIVDLTSNPEADVQQQMARREELVYELAETIKTLDEKSISEIKTHLGAGGTSISWRILQFHLNQKDKNFINDDLQQYIEEHLTDYNPVAQEQICTIEKTLLEKIRDCFSQNQNWFKDYLPEDLAIEIRQKQVADQFKGRNYDYWYYIHIPEIIKIAKTGDNWSELLQPILCYRDPETKKDVTKLNTLLLLKSLNDIKIKLQKGDHNTITKQDSEIVKNAYANYVGE